MSDTTRKSKNSQQTYIIFRFGNVLTVRASNIYAANKELNKLVKNEHKHQSALHL